MKHMKYMNYRLADFHCDTFEVLYNHKADLKSNNFHISLDKAESFKPYIQISAVWSDSRFSDEECYTRFINTYNYMKSQIEKYSDNAALCKSFSEIEEASDTKSCFVYAVEDARILCGDISRLDTLYDLGVRFLTLTWGGETIIGGSHNTDSGLTEFGRLVVNRCFETGIIPDISHASRKVTDEVLTLSESAGKPVIATHSNSYSVRNHTRNLTDDEFRRIIKCGGVTGISFAAEHLTDTVSNRCTVDTVISHIKHYFSLGGEDNVCLGCDFDGIGAAPENLENLSKLENLAEAMIKSGFSDEQTDKVFYLNAYNFMKNNL